MLIKRAGSVFRGVAKVANTSNLSTSPNSISKTRGLSLDSSDPTLANTYEGRSTPTSPSGPNSIHRYFEFDLNLHSFPYVAKNVLHLLHSTCFPKLLTCIGAVIEGRNEEELPEALLGSSQLVRVKREEAMSEKDYFG